MERWVKVSVLAVGDRFRFGSHPAVFEVIDLNGQDKNGPAIVYSTVGFKAQYKLTLLNPSIEVKKLV